MHNFMQYVNIAECTVLSLLSSYR